MAMRKTLYLHEELMLLALRDEKGTVAAGGMFEYILAGSLLSELLLQQRITVEETKKKIVTLQDESQCEDPILNESLVKLAAAKRRASLKTWVSRLARIKKLKHRTAEGLCRRGILRQDQDKVLGIFTRRLYPEIDPGPERHIIERLRTIIFTDTNTVEPRTAVLLSLAHNGDLLKNVFDKKELKTRKKRIKQISDGQITAKATKEVIEAVQAAVMVACVVPALAASTSSH